MRSRPHNNTNSEDDDFVHRHKETESVLHFYLSCRGHAIRRVFSYSTVPKNGKYPTELFDSFIKKISRGIKGLSCPSEEVIADVLTAENFLSYCRIFTSDNLTDTECGHDFFPVVNEDDFLDVLKFREDLAGKYLIVFIISDPSPTTRTAPEHSITTPTPPDRTTRRPAVSNRSTHLAAL